MKSAPRRCVLTVGEMRQLYGGRRNRQFPIEDGTVRIQINVDAAAQQQLRISSKLLSLSRRL